MDYNKYHESPGLTIRCKSNAYGEEPNKFVTAEMAGLKPGTIPLGRNTVYAATKNWEMSAFNSGTEGRGKSLQLAQKNNVNITYRIATYKEVHFYAKNFDCIVLIFARMPPSTEPILMAHVIW